MILKENVQMLQTRNRKTILRFFNLQVDCKAADLSPRAQRGGDQKRVEGEGKVVVTGTHQFARRVYCSV